MLAHPNTRYTIGMSDLPTPQDIEIMAVKAGMTTAQACRKAGLSSAVFFRWKGGKSSPTLNSLREIMAVLDEAIANNNGAKT